MRSQIKTFIGMSSGLVIGLCVSVLWILPNNSYQAVAADTTAREDSEYQTIQWVDLIPEEDLVALLNPPSVIDEIPDGSIDDSIEKIGELNKNSPYGRALKSTQIIPEFNDKKIRIPGFVVPLDSDEDQRITSFFLVPYFGACLHLPPPPPNQIIYAEFPKGLVVDVLYDPFWIEGTVKTEINSTMLGTSAYTMTVDRIEIYEE
ncbi:hypothetical protein NBRC116494_14650 [Aurantivibrio plasticivorans]